MADKRPAIVQNGRTYIFTGTEEIPIGKTIWTRDRYDNANGDPQSYLLMNFVDTHKSTNMRQEPLYEVVEELPKPRREKVDYRQYIEEWKAKGLVK